MRDAATLGWSLKTADAIHLSSAVRLKSLGVYASVEFHTYDDRLMSYGAMTGLTIVKPYAEQPKLFDC